ncbi:MAG: class I SAM-dependent methyltransferase [Ferruginibacter sp.]
MIHHSDCPVCSGNSIRFILSAKDHTVSQEIFEIWICNECSSMFTQDVPDENDIARYYESENYISHSDTQAGFINKIYHFVRKRTLVSKMTLIKNETGKPHGNILDVGCGTGAFLNVMDESGWQTTGLEPDPAAREKAMQLYHIHVQPPDTIFDLPKNSFDAITLWHVLEHIHQLHGHVEKLKELLIPGGKLFIAVPNYTSYDARVYKENWAGYDVPRHLYHFTPESIGAMMEKHGLTVIKKKAMWYDSFYVSMLSEKYKNGKGNITAAFVNGLISNMHAMVNQNKCSSLIYIISKDE